jgi:arylsulfatase A-like enzyme
MHSYFNMMSRAGMVALAILLLPASGPAATPEKPNIVFILADDHGYGDLGVQGARDVETPNLDRLARQGARLTDFYANHPVCGPSRAGLMTARYQHRFGYENNGPMGPGSPNGLPVDEPTVPERLKRVGYATGMTGKWHLGFQPHHVPTARGFDFYYGTLRGAMAYVPDGASGAKTVLRGTQEEPMPAHVTEGFGEESVKFIEQNKGGPFFLYVSFTAVHAPLQTTQAYLDRFPDEKDPDRRIYLGMLAAMDDQIGNIVSTIDRLGLGDNTLIMYSSDNGGPTWQTTSANTPLNGVKALTLEGGIRVPTIIRWTGTIPAGQVLSTMGIGHDLTATALAVAGVDLDDRIDGVNLMPYLTGAATGDAHDRLYWRFTAQGAVREGPWKLVKVGEKSYLFNLADDIGERSDLAAEEPERLKQMEASFEAWSASVEQPAFGPTAEGVIRIGLAARVQGLVADYVAGRPVNPRPLLYGGGPE